MDNIQRQRHTYTVSTTNVYKKCIFLVNEFTVKYRNKLNENDVVVVVCGDDEDDFYGEFICIVIDIYRFIYIYIFRTGMKID